MHCEDLGQGVDYILTRDAPIQHPSQVFSDALVHDRQPLQLATARRSITHEVPTQYVIRSLRPPPVTAVGTRVPPSQDPHQPAEAGPQSRLYRVASSSENSFQPLSGHQDSLTRTLNQYLGRRSIPQRKLNR
jgi:hypothetical protein